MRTITIRTVKRQLALAAGMPAHDGHGSGVAAGTRSVSACVRRRTAAARAAGGVGRRLLATVLALAAVLSVFMVASVKLEIEETDWTHAALQYQLSPIRGRGIHPYDQLFAGPINFALDLHTHSTASDGRACSHVQSSRHRALPVALITLHAGLTPEQLVDYAVAEGLDGLAVTDHQDRPAGVERARAHAAAAHPGLLVVLGGVEFTSCRCHLNLILGQN